MAARAALRGHQFPVVLELLGGFHARLTLLGQILELRARASTSGALAALLFSNPDLLLLDEPTRGVDVGARAEIHAEVRRLADAGSAVVFASSELEEVLLLADRILVLERGQLVEQGTHADLLVRNGAYARLHALQFNRGSD